MTADVKTNCIVFPDSVFEVKLGLVADPVMEVIARLEFQDVLRTGVLLGGCLDP